MTNFIEAVESDQLRDTRALQVLGDRAFVVGDFVNALSRYTDSAQLGNRESSNAQGILSCLLNLHRNGRPIEKWPEIWMGNDCAQPLDAMRAIESYIQADKIQLIQDQLENSLRGFQEAVRLVPFFARAWNRVGGIELRRKKYALADAAYKTACMLDPTDESSHLGVGYVSLILGRLDEAEREFRKLIARNPNYAEPHVALGWMYNDHCLEEKAYAEFAEAIRLDPRSDGGHEGMAFAFLFKKDVAMAIHHFKVSIECNPNNGGSHVGLGNIAVEQGEYTKAENYYQIALKISPYDESAWNGLGYIAEAQARWSDAEVNFRKAMAYTPAQPFSYISLARLCARQKRFKEAAEIYQACLKLLFKGDSRQKLELDYAEVLKQLTQEEKIALGVTQHG